MGGLTMSDQEGDGEYDVIVIGAGPVGENVADYAHQGGLSVAIVESDLAGGECSYWACIPSKALLRPIAARGAALRLPGAKQAVTGEIDVAAVLRRRDSFVANYDDSGQAHWIAGAGITLIRGVGRLAGPRRVRVHADSNHDTRTLTARLAVVVCTGSEPTVPPIEGLADARPWTNRDATGMTRVPRRLAIIGGGVVACEMATAAVGLGAEQVTMLVRSERILGRVEPFAADLVQRGLEDRGVTVRLGTAVTRVTRRGDGDVMVTADNGDPIVADEVLLATGRAPRTGDIGLDTVGLTPGEALSTDDGLVVRGAEGNEVEWLFAAGDVTGRAALTHQGKYEARLLGDRLAAQARGDRLDLRRWGAHTATADTAATPQVIFTDPQVAAVGITQSQAAELGVDVVILDYDLANVSGAALHADGYAGRAEFVVDRDREVLLGATFVGQDVADLLHSATIAIVGEVPLSRLWHAVPSFPTISEVWLRLMEQWRQRSD